MSQTDIAFHQYDVADRVQLALLRVGAVALGPWWRISDLCSPYWRLYLNKQDGARIMPRHGATMTLRARRLYLVPPWIHFASDSARGVDHIFCHFDLHGPPGTLVREVFPRPLALPSSPAQEVALAEAGERLLSDSMVTPAAMCRWKSIAYAALAAAMEALPTSARKRFLSQVRVAGPLSNAVEHVQMNLGGELGNAILAARCGVSSDHLLRLFRRHFGQTPADYVLERRISAAAHDLAYGRTPVDDIAVRCGFSDRFSFSKAFKRLVGTAPAAWRKRHQEAAPLS